jgi:hypothetical protein
MAGTRKNRKRSTGATGIRFIAAARIAARVFDPRDIAMRNRDVPRKIHRATFTP